MHLIIDELEKAYLAFVEDESLQFVSVAATEDRKSSSTSTRGVKMLND